MGSLTSLTDPSVLLVADAGVIISLNATGCGPQVIRALPNRLVIADAVPAEDNFAGLGGFELRVASV